MHLEKTILAEKPKKNKAAFKRISKVFEDFKIDEKEFVMTYESKDVKYMH